MLIVSISRNCGTALHLAAVMGNAESGRILSSHPSIDVNIKDSNGKTPLHLAAEMGQIEVVRFLSSHPTIDVNA